MPTKLNGEHCVSCGAAAAVRVAGTSFCASCGLRQHRATEFVRTPPTVHRSHRGALVGILSSGFLVKMLMGAVALAAVGGATASLRSEPVPAAADVIPAVITTVMPSTTATPFVITDDDVSESTPEVGAAVDEYVVAVQIWAACVSDAATAHSGGSFDPREACGPRPEPGDFGLDDHDEDGPGNSENAPGHDENGPGNSENAPGHDENGPGNSENAPGHSDGDEEKKDKPPKEKDK